MIQIIYDQALLILENGLGQFLVPIGWNICIQAGHGHAAMAKLLLNESDVFALNEFNEQGWDKCYLRIADLLDLRKDIQGMIGTSWFYDPQLLEISPRLAYLQKCPLERGAFLLRHGTGHFDIEHATMTSKTRRRLYNETFEFCKIRLSFFFIPEFSKNSGRV